MAPESRPDARRPDPGARGRRHPRDRGAGDRRPLGPGPRLAHGPRPLDADGTAAELLDELAAAANGLPVGTPRRTGSWRFPGPSTTSGGVGLFRDVGKFDSLYGVDVRRGLMTRIRPSPSEVRFLNDADAFGVGEYAVGAARGHDRAVCITLGTGVGSAFLDRGRPVNSGPTVPPDGSIHLVVHDGRPLEETVSRRAIRTAYAAAAGGRPPTAAPDVHVIAERSRQGDDLARAVLHARLRRPGSRAGPARPAVRGQHRGHRRLHGRLVGHRRAGGPAAACPGPRPDPVTCELRPAERNPVAALLGAAFWSVNQPALTVAYRGRRP